MTSVILTVPAMAMADSAARFSIARQPMATALKAFAEQAHMEILYRYDAVSAATGNAVSGELDKHAALETLLNGTGLEAVYSSDGAATIRPIRATTTSEGTQSTQSSPSQAGERDKSNSDTFLVAQAAVGQAVSPTSVSAPSPEPQARSGDELEEIIVTAQKRQERLLDVPVSIVALSAEDLERRQLTTLEDVATAVPDLSFVRVGATYLFQIRGISASASTTSSVGVYIDDADTTLGGIIGLQPNLITYDLERVEVLRGPQGTLYGDGSIGGTIRFITKNPNLTNFAFDSQAAALFTEHGDPSQRINAMMNVPLIENQLGLRIAGTFEHDGGWIDQPAANSENINDENLSNVRIKGLWQPNAQLAANAMVIINRDVRGFDASSDTNSPYTWIQVFNLQTAPRLRNDYELYSLTLTYDFGFAQVLNNTSYLSEDVPIYNNGSTLQLFEPPPYPPFSFYTPYQDTTDRLLTNELRFTSTGSGPWKWTIGALYRHYLDYSYLAGEYVGQAGPPGSPLPEPPVTTNGKALYKDWSVFADTSYQLWGRLTLGAGVRHFTETQEVTDLSGMSPQKAADFSSVDPRFYAQFKLSPEASIYTSASKGFRSGGFNAPGQPTFNPESVWSYELGTKMAAAKFAFDLALFSSDYTDFAAYGVVTSSPDEPIVSNAGRARIKGVEWDMSWLPSPQWRFDFRGDSLSARFTEINATSTAYAPGDYLDNVPEYQVGVSAQRSFQWRGREDYVRLDYTQQGPSTLTNRSVGPWYYSETDVLHLLNFRASFQVNRNLSVGFTGQNLLNEQGWENPYYKSNAGVRPRPRTFGVDFSTTLD